jgi:hypothetical protein
MAINDPNYDRETLETVKGIDLTSGGVEARKESLKGTIKKSSYENYTSSLLEDHKHFGGDTNRSLPASIEKVKTIDGETKVKTSKSSGLGKKVEKINELHEDLERLRERAKEPDYADKSKGEGKRITKEITDMEKELKKLGSKTQEGVGKTLEAFDKRHDAAKKQHRKNIETLEDKAAEYKKLLHPDKVGIDQKTKTLSFKKNIAEPITVEITTAPGTKSAYTVGVNGQITAGEGALAVENLSHEHLKEIRKTTHRKITDHFDKEVSMHKDRFSVAEQEADAVRKHLKDKIGKNVAEKTTIGEWTKKGASQATPGGAKAASMGVIGEAEYNKLGPMGKAQADVVANWHSGTVGKIQTVVGAVGVADGLRRVWNSVTSMGSSDPEKKDDNSMGNLVVGLAEIGGSTLLTRVGGGKVAQFGHSKA